MPNCTNGKLTFGRVGRRIVEAAFDGGDIVSDGGAVLLRQVDQRIGLTRAAAAVFNDPRRLASVKHGMREMLAQRIYSLCCGWQDVTDHNTLRRDLVLQTAVGQVDDLASGPTLSRLDTSATAEQAAALHGVLLDQFIASRSAPAGPAPHELILDIDATHMPLHGQQERAHFNRFYDNYCYLPLYVFCGQDLLACVLRPSDRDPAGVVSALIKLLVARLRQAWPKTRLIVRADGGFCRARVLRRLEKWNVRYIIGLPKNAHLNACSALAACMLADEFAQHGVKQRAMGEFRYAARSWNRERRVIARLEHDRQGADARYIVTDLDGQAQHLYEQVYCARGEAENRIKEAQLDLFGRRASCHKYRGNQLRLLLAGLAYTLMINLRRLGLKNTELAKACTATIRTKLLKIGAAVIRNTRRVRLLLASSHPLQHVFITAARALGP